MIVIAIAVLAIAFVGFIYHATENEIKASQDEWKSLYTAWYKTVNCECKPTQEEFKVMWLQLPSKERAAIALKFLKQEEKHDTH